MRGRTPGAAFDVNDLAPAEIDDLLSRGAIVLVDVREAPEFVAERIPGSHLAPLSSFDPAALRAEHGDRRLVFHCHLGVRSVEAALRYRRGDERPEHLAGGIEAWKASGRATEPGRPIDGA